MVKLGPVEKKTGKLIGLQNKVIVKGLERRRLKGTRGENADSAGARGIKLTRSVVQGRQSYHKRNSCCRREDIERRSLDQRRR